MTPFKRQVFRTFFYGMATEDQLSPLIADAEAEGCELVQVVPAPIPDPRPQNLLIPGAPQKPGLVLAYRVLVRILESEVEALAARQAARAKAQEPASGGVK